VQFGHAFVHFVMIDTFLRCLNTCLIRMACERCTFVSYLLFLVSEHAGVNILKRKGFSMFKLSIAGRSCSS